MSYKTRPSESFSDGLFKQIRIISCLSVQTQHILHIKQTFIMPAQPYGGAYGTGGKRHAAAGFVTDFHAFAVGGKQGGVVADNIAGAHGGKADGGRVARAGVAFATIHGALLQIAAERIGHLRDVATALSERSASDVGRTYAEVQVAQALTPMLKAAATGRPLILITGEPSEELAAMAQTGEITAFLTKPFELAFIKNLLTKATGTAAST